MKNSVTYLFDTSVGDLLFLSLLRDLRSLLDFLLFRPRRGDLFGDLDFRGDFDFLGERPFFGDLLGDFLGDLSLLGDLALRGDLPLTLLGE